MKRHRDQVDGKAVRGARRPDGPQVYLLSAVLHSSGVTIAQVEVDRKSNEIPLSAEGESNQLRDHQTKEPTVGTDCCESLVSRRCRAVEVDGPQRP
jgi:hypothetical protein